MVVHSVEPVIPNLSSLMNDHSASNDLLQVFRPRKLNSKDCSVVGYVPLTPEHAILQRL